MLCGMWGLPRSGIEPVSPALAGGSLTTAPPGKPLISVFLITAMLTAISVPAGSHYGHTHGGTEAGDESQASRCRCRCTAKGASPTCARSSEGQLQGLGWHLALVPPQRPGQAVSADARLQWLWGGEEGAVEDIRRLMAENW